MFWKPADFEVKAPPPGERRRPATDPAADPVARLGPARPGPAERPAAPPPQDGGGRPMRRALEAPYRLIRDWLGGEPAPAPRREPSVTGAAPAPSVAPAPSIAAPAAAPAAVDGEAALAERVDRLCRQVEVLAATVEADRAAQEEERRVRAENDHRLHQLLDVLARAIDGLGGGPERPGR
jgi:hypothetical protein